MQYFTALKLGEKRVKAAQDVLTKYTGHGMPALALKDNKDNKWEPVGEENLFAVVKEASGSGRKASHCSMLLTSPASLSP